MRNKTFTIGILALALVFGGCKKINEIFTKKVNTDFTVTLAVAIGSAPTNSGHPTFFSTNTLNPLDNEDIAPYLENINNIDVTGITGRVSELTADVNLSNVTLVVNTAVNSTQWTFANLPLTNGMVIPFDNTGGQWTKINQILNEQGPLMVTLTGTADKENVTFNIEVKFQSEVVVEVL